jgi:hypothetical protein
VDTVVIEVHVAQQIQCLIELQERIGNGHGDALFLDLID